MFVDLRLLSCMYATLCLFIVLFEDIIQIVYTFFPISLLLAIISKFFFAILAQCFIQNFTYFYKLPSYQMSSNRLQ
jgi:hypothetical protein